LFVAKIGKTYLIGGSLLFRWILTSMTSW